MTKPSPVRRAFSLIVPSSTTKSQPTIQFFKTLPFLTTARSQMMEFSITTLKINIKYYKYFRYNYFFLPFFNCNIVHYVTVTNSSFCFNNTVGSKNGTLDECFF